MCGDNSARTHFLSLLAGRLIAYRLANGFFQERVALEIGCAVATYRALELWDAEPNRPPDPKLSTMMRVLSVLELDAPVLDVLANAISNEPDGSCKPSNARATTGSCSARCCARCDSR